MQQQPTTQQQQPTTQQPRMPQQQPKKPASEYPKERSETEAEGPEGQATRLTTRFQLKNKPAPRGVTPTVPMDSGADSVTLKAAGTQAESQKAEKGSSGPSSSAGEASAS